MKVTLLDYGAGNIQSVQFALERLGVNAILSNNKEDILSSDKVIFPGVGQASQAMKQLKATGLEHLNSRAKTRRSGNLFGNAIALQNNRRGEHQRIGRI